MDCQLDHMCDKKVASKQNDHHIMNTRLHGLNLFSKLVGYGRRGNVGKVICPNEH